MATVHVVKRHACTPECAQRCSGPFTWGRHSLCLQCVRECANTLIQPPCGLTQMHGGEDLLREPASPWKMDTAEEEVPMLACTPWSGVYIMPAE